MKLRILTVIFLAYFSFYSVSQLTYNTNDRKADFLCTHSQSSRLIQLKFAFANLLSDFFAGQNVADHDDSSDLVLLRKKRAVLSSQKIIKKLSQLENAVAEGQDFTLAPDLSHCMLLSYNFRPIPGFLRYRSGLSPPLV